ncbi:hypothetical protein ACIGKM_11665 [Ectopseudomonas toyotomiensis]|uniref:hypothetical protein n=1 Tax=Ectopseudomonas toyotomiensis TaxID=554344 RepID=UPI0037C90297
MSPDLKYTTPDGQQITPTSARQWVAVISKLPTKAERQAAIDNHVPAHLRELVLTMGRIAWNHPARSKQ